MGAVGALAPTVFLPRPEIIHISVPHFLPRPEVVLIYLHPCYLVQFGASEYIPYRIFLNIVIIILNQATK